MKIFTNIIVKIIKIYQLIVSPYLGSNCRFVPTCSQYFIDALREHGFLRGSLMGFKRLLSCHPIKLLGGKEGFDPVKKKVK